MRISDWSSDVCSSDLARGYVGRPDLTAERFIANPFCNQQDCAIAYRSGELVTLGLDGKLRFQGRADDQVKISGYRIELDEISTCLLQAPGVSDAVAVVHRLNQQAPALIVGHVAGTDPHSAQILIRHAQSHLPPNMVPHSILLPQPLPPRPP